MEKIKKFYINIIFSALNTVRCPAQRISAYYVVNIQSMVIYLASEIACKILFILFFTVITIDVYVRWYWWVYMCVCLRFFFRTKQNFLPHQIFHFNLVWFLPFVAVGVSHFLYMFEMFELWTKAIFDFLCILQGFSDGISIWARKLSRQVIKQLW